MIRLLILLSLSLMLAGCAYFTADMTGAEAARAEAEEMDAAIARAQEALPVFAASLAAPGETQIYFAVLARFALEDGISHEDLWIEKVAYDGEAFSGVLASEPALWEGGAAGALVTAAEADIVDWMIVENTRIVGAYTVRVLRERMSMRERIDLSRRLGLPIVDPE